MTALRTTLAFVFLVLLLGGAADARADDAVGDEEVVERHERPSLAPPSPALERPAGPAGYGLIGALGAIASLALVAMSFSGGGACGLSYRSYYLFWLIAPLLLALLSAHPLVLLLIPIGWLARRWLPDPWLWLRRAGKIGSLRRIVAANAHDLVARRQLAMLLLEQRAPKKALPLVDEALAREPQSAELHYLRGLCLLGAEDWQAALDAFIAALQRDPRYRYGDPYLRAADALGALGRWADAAESLEHFLAINGSSLEGRCKLVRAHKKLGDATTAERHLVEARRCYAQMPSFQRRKQLAWYCRTFVPVLL
jgi:tetratricopeptide (TPR) repeat protein